MLTITNYALWMGSKRSQRRLIYAENGESMNHPMRLPGTGRRQIPWRWRTAPTTMKGQRASKQVI
ncbi:MAG: hypothetical protein ACLUOF_03485 [Ruminococcus sp.]